LKALEPKVSSKGSPANEGVGLTLTSKLAEQVGAWLLIVSGDGAVRMRPKQGMRVERLPGGERYGGTLVALTFPQGKAQNFPELLDLAKQASGLLQPKPGRGRFTP
jgi:pantothenate kinase